MSNEITILQFIVYLHEEADVDMVSNEICEQYPKVFNKITIEAFIRECISNICMVSDNIEEAQSALSQKIDSNFVDNFYTTAKPRTETILGQNKETKETAIMIAIYAQKDAFFEIVNALNVINNAKITKNIVFNAFSISYSYSITKALAPLRQKTKYFEEDRKYTIIHGINAKID